MQACTARKDSGAPSCSLSLVPTTAKLPRRRAEAPSLPVVPLFDELTRLSHVSRMASIVYGVIAAFHALGHEPTRMQIAYAARMTDSDRARACLRLITDLERAHLLRRVRVRRNFVRFELLGPTWEHPI